jgi:electron transfer flavoprotein alpha subunit
VILVIAEQRDRRLNRASWEAIAAAQQLSADAPVVVGLAGADVATLAAELAAADVK